MKGLKNIFYSVLDMLTLHRGIPRKINGHSIRFPARWSRYFESDYEKENIAFLSAHCKPGMYIVDIGAHLGLFSIICAKLLKGKGKVFAFEPTPGTFATLKQIIELNNFQEIVQPVNKAVSDKEGTIDFHVDPFEGSNANSLVTRTDRNRSTIPIGVTSVDAFMKENQIGQLNILKIDAEGVELDVLKGSVETIKKQQPFIILALHPQWIINNGQNLESIYDLVASLGYTVFLHDKKIDKAEFCSIKDLFDVHLIPGKV